MGPDESGGSFVSQDTIFISGLPEDATEEDLAEYFGQIGVIKQDKKRMCPKIWIYKDKITGKGKGEATLTYDDPPTATSAITWFNGKEFKGCKLSIELAQRKSAPQTFSRGPGRGGFGGGRGGFRNEGFNNGGAPRQDRQGGGRPGGGRPGDWPCPSCNNNNFAYRQECNRCRTPKPAGGGGGGGGGGGDESSGSHYNNNSSNNSRNGGGSRFHQDDNRSGGGGAGAGAGGGGYSRGGNDFRGQNRDRQRDWNRGDSGNASKDGYRDRTDRDGGYRGGGGGGGRYGSGSYGGSGGPSRNHDRPKDDRRSRPY